MSDVLLDYNGLARYDSKIKEYIDQHAGSSGILTAFTVSLPVAGWSNKVQTVSATGVTASNVVIACPAPLSIEDYASYGVKCVAQAIDTLTFECDDVPDTALTINIIVFAAEFSMFYTGVNAPASSLGSDGDIYLQE